MAKTSTVWGTVRFRHGSNAAADDPLVWYSGSGLTTKRWLHADQWRKPAPSGGRCVSGMASITAWTNASGGSPTLNKYDEYGVPAAANTGRFQYTGQMLIPELGSAACPGLYYYKARFYSPCLGRFMQTDPVGYEGGINLYGYVDDEPVNRNDPAGLAGDCTGSNIDCGGGISTGSSGSSTASITGNKRTNVSWGANNNGQGWPSVGALVQAQKYGIAGAIRRGRQIADEELARTQRLAPIGRGHNDIFDAERHARWTYRMAQELGPGLAQLFSDEHEYQGLLRGEPVREFKMDLHNNMVGIRAFERGEPIPNTTTRGLIYFDHISSSQQIH